MGPAVLLGLLALRIGQENGDRGDDREADQDCADQVGEVVARVERLVGRASPSASRLSVRPVASVASTARPIAPPTWTVVLTRPDARPASLGVAPDIASVISAGKREARAEAEQHLTGKTSAQ